MDNLAWDWLVLTKEQRAQKLKALIAGQANLPTGQVGKDYIQLVDAGKLGVYASLGSHFDYAIFGRDSIQVAEDLLDSHQPLAQRIIHTLASLQGIKTDTRNEEEAGKIHHEYRALKMHGSTVSEQSVEILRKLQDKWGDPGTDYVRYYGSYDATPLFIRLVGRYVQRYGPGLLDEPYQALDGPKKIKDSLQAAVSWLTSKIDGSDWGLLEYQRLNKDFGLANQVWKDSGTSYLHSDSSLPNFEAGIAAIELQGYAYDALEIAQVLLLSSPQKDYWHQLSSRLQAETASRFWMPQQNYFAQALDHDTDNNPRQIDTLTSNPGLLLDSKLLDNLPEAQSYIDALATMLMSPEFLTPAGIRCRALCHKQMPGFVDYHGSYTVWPKETYAISRGLRAHGKANLASKLESCLLDSVKRAGEFYEFFYVDDREKAYYDQSEALEHFRTISLDKNLAVAEPGQAWTISAVLAILSRSIKQ